MTDLVAVVALWAVGWVLLATWTTAGPLRVAAALPTGVAALATVELVLLAAVPTGATPRAALVVAVLSAGALVVARRPVVDPRERRWLVAAGVVAIVATALVLVLPVVNVTVDSFRYLSVATLLVRGEALELASSETLQKRGLATAVVHGLAPTDPGYLRALGPLVGLSTLGLVGAVVRRELAWRGRGLASAATLAVVALLATNHRFVFSALYVNSHALIAVWLLLLVVVGWWVVREPQLATPWSVVVVGTLVTALTVARPEGVLLAVLALAPVVLAAEVARWWRVTTLVGVGAVSLVWHGVVLWVRTTGVGSSPGIEVLGLVAVGIGLVVVGVGLGLVDRVVARAPGGTTGVLVAGHGLLWVALVVLAVGQPQVLLSSVNAVVRNVTADGLWGSSLWLLAVLLVVAAVVTRVPRSSVLWFPVLSFVPLGLLLALLRGGAYRFGPGDSLNRMLIHVVPLAVTILGVSIGGEVRARWRAGVDAAAAATAAATGRASQHR